MIGIAGWAVVVSCLAAQAPPMYVPPDIQAPRLIHEVPAVYPKLAKQARIQGTVKLAAIIDEHGIVDRLKLISGHPLLVDAAFDAVKQWRYRPLLWNGVPRAVVTTIEVTFTMDGLAPRRTKPTETIRA